MNKITPVELLKSDELKGLVDTYGNEPLGVVNIRGMLHYVVPVDAVPADVRLNIELERTDTAQLLFNLSDLVSFGNCLLSAERMNKFKDGYGFIVGERANVVHDADIANWKESVNQLNG